MKLTNHWANFGVKLYYLIGFFYYVYAWFIIGGGLGVIASLVGSYTIGPNFWWFVAGACSLIALVIGLGISFANWRKRYKSVNSGLKILSSHSTYRILPNKKFEYRREVELSASIDGVDHFTHVFGWTGSGRINVVAENGYRAELSNDEKSTRNRLRVYFDRPRAKGERLTVAYKFEMDDPAGQARNFLRTSMHEKTRKLIIQVIFAEGNCPARCKETIYMSQAAEIPIYDEDILVAREQHSILWLINKPRLGYDYCISW